LPNASSTVAFGYKCEESDIKNTCTAWFCMFYIIDLNHVKHAYNKKQTLIQVFVQNTIEYFFKCCIRLRRKIY